MIRYHPIRFYTFISYKKTYFKCWIKCLICRFSFYFDFILHIIYTYQFRGGDNILSICACVHECRCVKLQVNFPSFESFYSFEVNNSTKAVSLVPCDGERRYANYTFRLFQTSCGLVHMKQYRNILLFTVQVCLLKMLG